jgi:hypothetical protein
MAGSIVALALLLTACGASAPPSPSVGDASAAAPGAGNLGLTIGEFQDRWNASIGTDSLRMTDVSETAIGFESRIHPILWVSGTTDGDGMVTMAQVTYIGSTDNTDPAGAIEVLNATIAFSALPLVVGLSLTENEANDALVQLDWPSPDEGLAGIQVDGIVGDVRYATRDQGAGGIVMTATPAE